MGKYGHSGRLATQPKNPDLIGSDRRSIFKKFGSLELTQPNTFESGLVDLMSNLNDAIRQVTIKLPSSYSELHILHS